MSARARLNAKPRHVPVKPTRPAGNPPSLYQPTRGSRARGTERLRRRAFAPPESWYEPRLDEDAGYRIVVQPPGEGYRHVVTPDDIRQRLARVPPAMLRGLEVIQLSRMTRKKQLFPCYGMQWGSAIYLYPLVADLVERFSRPPRPGERIEAAAFGGRWERAADGSWRLLWTESAARDFYLNNILMHELGHLRDHRNTTFTDRERYAEWFAVQYGYKPSRESSPSRRHVRRRHHGKRLRSARR